MELEITCKIRVEDGVIYCLMQDGSHPTRGQVIEYLKQCQVDLIKEAYCNGEELKIVSVKASEINDDEAEVNSL